MGTTVIDLLYNVSLRVPDLLILLVCALVFGMAGVLVAKLSYWLWWSRVPERKEAKSDMGDGVHSSILALIGFLLALITTSELSSFSNTDKQITHESLEITRIDRDLTLLGQQGDEARRLLRGYVESVATDEWPRLARRPQSLSPSAEQNLNALWTEVRRLQLIIRENSPNIASDLSSYTHKIEEARLSRLSASINSIPDIVWVMIGLFLLSACVLAGRHHLSRYAMQVLFIQMSGLGIIIALNIIIDNPFGGDTSLTPDRLVAAVSRA